MSDDKIEVILRINKEAAGYFKRRQLITNQVLIKELEDGGLMISAKGHINQILPIVRYWIPNIQIISPDFMQVNLEKELSDYLKQNVLKINN